MKDGWMNERWMDGSAEHLGHTGEVWLDGDVARVQSQVVVAKHSGESYGLQQTRLCVRVCV